MGHIKTVLDNHEVIKHGIDTVALPGGVITGLTYALGLVNGILTTLVLLASLIWTVYRIKDMKNTQRRKKREG